MRAGEDNVQGSFEQGSGVGGALGLQRSMKYWKSVTETTQRLGEVGVGSREGKVDNSPLQIKLARLTGPSHSNSHQGLVLSLSTPYPQPHLRY